jgi:hypothetical protein
VSTETADPWGQRDGWRGGRFWRVKGWARCGWRWHVAELLNRAERTCWVDLVEWALTDVDAPWWRGWLPRFPRHYKGMDGERWRLRDVTGDSSSCRAERDDPRLCGCYCGKFRVDADGTRHP